MPVTKEQQKIYNQHLSSYRRHQNKPYTLRENFDDFEKEKPEDYVNLMKLERIFNQHSQLNRRYYFEAPYKIYPDKDYFNLQFYTTMAAIKTYSLYMKQINAASPDSPDQMYYINDSLIFIRNFCIENNITLSQYLAFRKYLALSWATHLADHNISIYVFLGFDYLNLSVYDMFFNMPEDERELLLGDIIENYPIYKDNLNKSKHAKHLVIEGLKGINKYIKNNLKSNLDCDTIKATNQ